MTATAAPRYWRGPLQELGIRLRAEARATPKVWAWYELPHGARVGCQLDPATGRLTFRIARATKPKSADRQRWELELSTFARHLGLAGWPQHDEDVKTGTAARYVEPAG